jgi:hypothetical protein
MVLSLFITQRSYPMTNLSTTIDALGRIKAQISDLKIQEDALKDALMGLAPGAYEGDLFRLSVSDTTRETLDMKAVREHLSRQFVAAHTNVSEVRTLRVAARSGKALAA